MENKGVSMKKITILVKLLIVLVIIAIFLTWLEIQVVL